MRKAITQSILLILSLSISMFIISCSGKNTVKLADTNFSDEISQHQRLEFIFNTDIAPDSVLNVWDSTIYITFDPEIKGRFKWTYANKLAFSPEEPFKPSTEYTARLKSKIISHLGEKFRFKQEKI